jgi:hypothetical protein
VIKIGADHGETAFPVKTRVVKMANQNNTTVMCKLFLKKAKLIYNTFRFPGEVIVLR